MGSGTIHRVFLADSWVVSPVAFLHMVVIVTDVKVKSVENWICIWIYGLV